MEIKEPEFGYVLTFAFALFFIGLSIIGNREPKDELTEREKEKVETVCCDTTKIGGFYTVDTCAGKYPVINIQIQTVQ